MTDDQRPEDEPAPSTEATPNTEAAPSAEPAAPPPLAPYVNQAQADPQPAAAPPPIAPPPAVTWAAPAAAAAAPAGVGQRTILSAISGILLLLGGILGGIAGLAVMLVGGSFAEALGDYVDVPGLGGQDAGTILGGMVAFIGALILVYSLVYLFAGIGVLRNRGWGRVMGLIVGILSGLIWLGTVMTPTQPNVQESIVGSLIALGIHVYIVVTLLFFWRSKPSAA